jgi:hypothetical protein
MAKPTVPPTATDDEVRALLVRYRCPVPFHEVRTRFLGNIASPGMGVSPIRVVESLWGGKLPEFEAIDAANELVGALVMGLWNRLSRHQDRNAPFRLTRIETGATREGLAALVRGPSLDADMSRYLVERIAARSNIEVLTQTVVTALEGRDGILEAIRCRSHRSGEEVRRAVRHLFLFIGAAPNTEWLSRSGVTLDDKGFVHTEANIGSPLETSLPGVFAIGDVRSGSVKRVAAAVGEGAQVVAALHAFLGHASDAAGLTTNTGRS